MRNPVILSAAAAFAAIGAALADDAAWTARAPLQDTYVGSSAGERGVPHGDATGLVVGNGREAFLMFDASGLSGVSAAKVRLHCTQCGSTDGVVWPLYLRVMDDDSWSETGMTWNAKPAELRVYPSPVLATDDPSLAGYVEIPAGSAGSWIEADVTEAVRAAAPRGRLALHVYTSWDGNSGDTTPLAFASAEYADDASLRPQLAFQGAADASAASLTLLPVADTFVRSGGQAGNPQNGDSILVDNSAREGFLKFDLSGLDATSVDSAILMVRTYSGPNQNNHTADSTVQFQLMPDSSWTEASLTWNTASQYGVTPGAAWASEAPSGAVRAAGAATNCFHSIELAPLVNQVLAAGGTTMSLHLSMPDSPQRYFIFYSKDYAVEAWRPRLLVTPKAPVAVAYRTPVQETFVSDYNSANMDKSFYNGTYASYVQVGCDGDKVQYATMLFDPSGLENADFVRIRVANRKEIAAGPGALRVAAWTTDAWSETNLTWNTAAPWFPQPATVADGTALDGEVASVKLAQAKDAGTYFEVDVTAAARAAASAGRMLTVGLFSNLHWPEFHKGASASPAVLLFPDPDAEFGARVVASLDESGDSPALRLSWSPLPSGEGEYSVERRDGAAWRTVASGLSDPTCLDPSAEPWTEYTYRITGYDAADGSSTSVEKTVALEAGKTVFCESDTYVQNGTSAGKTFGTESSMIVKYNYQEGSGDVREALFRFDLSEAPTRFLSATLKLDPTGPAGNATGNENLQLYKMPDFEWSDAAAPTWNDVFGNGYATPQARQRENDAKRMAETHLGTWVSSEHGGIRADSTVEYDITAAVKAALAAGETHLTLHAAAYDPQSSWNFGLVTRERAQGLSIAPRIEFALNSWVRRPFVLTVR